MAKKNDNGIWFGCPKCGYKRKPDKVENGFEHYNCGVKCPQCGTITGMQFAPFVPKDGK